MGEDHIGICEGRRRESHWGLRAPKDLHRNGYRALTLLEVCIVCWCPVHFMHANMRN